jgi:hypothetical protein
MKAALRVWIPIAAVAALIFWPVGKDFAQGFAKGFARGYRNGRGETETAISPEKVTYRVTGTASRVSLTYQNASGGSQQETVFLPWRLAVTVPVGTFLSLLAQNQGASGTVDGRLYVDTELVQTSSSSVPYGIATVSGAVGSMGFGSMTDAEHIQRAKAALKLELVDDAGYHMDAIQANKTPAAEAARREVDDAMEILKREYREGLANLMQAGVQAKGYEIALKAVGDELVVSSNNASHRSAFLQIVRHDSGFGCSIGLRRLRFEGNGLPPTGKEYSLGCK